MHVFAGLARWRFAHGTSFAVHTYRGWLELRGQPTDPRSYAYPLRLQTVDEMFTERQARRNVFRFEQALDFIAVCNGKLRCEPGGKLHVGICDQRKHAVLQQLAIANTA